MGIIPARAGFTCSSPSGRRWTWDHPRSRGVYYKSELKSVSNFGSSPLARGLPSRITAIRPPTRIIPARAGFTITEVVREALSEDHPRSRGVYSLAAAVEPEDLGSSPLARGLLVERPLDAAFEGIIPARAGFTSSRPGISTLFGDHPRSRGVYVYELLAALDVVRIIPARAGFTGCRAPASCPRTDHPRSRGVYSALAGPRGPVGRIIPARAGFTPR